ncbi:MAG: double-strand break repair helicase AddA [Paracoccaceae bacterium]
MTRDEASLRQVEAADPALSTWLSANAGSGKTRVLTDRVARLLLKGTEPQRILCLTYTKAAASEMQNRLFARLGEWAMLPEADLRRALAELGVDGRIGADTIGAARRLFARAIETPGGLKIQTIHSFCASLLRRFPLEARVSPDFTELDDRAAKLLRQEIVEEMAGGGDIAAVDALARQLSTDDLSGFLNEICRNRDGFEQPLDAAEALRLFGLPGCIDAAGLLAEVFQGGEVQLLNDLLPVLEAGKTNDQKAARALRPMIGAGPSLAGLETLESVLLHGKSAAKAGPFTAKTGSFPTKAVAEGAAAPMMPEVEALMLRVEAARPKRLAFAAAEKTRALHQFATAFLARYAAQKAAAGWLDFDDLITRSAALLADRSVAAWVLYRLDGGIDHILVDEAQDTSPAQWQVIERLAEEFTAGEGARNGQRTIFVVGDMKQSIYSFQGADLEAFGRMRDHFRDRHDAVAAPFQPLELVHSFRSSPAILNVVDLTFDDRVSRGLGGDPKHRAFHESLPGRVDLWAAIPPTNSPEGHEWYDPVNSLPGDHHTIILARRIAKEIRRMIDAGVRIPHRKGERPVHEGDFLILVQRRSPLFHEIIRACKAGGLSIAGADRLRLGGELAVKDLAALINFLATPEDDLALATALRSPLLGWSEGQLFNLAHSRGDKTFLWSALRKREEEFPDTVAVLHDLRDQADFLRPYDLLERILTRHQGRSRLIGRLGIEAEDGIDSLLEQALAFERTEIPSLTGFLSWMEIDDVEVKRRLDSASKSIRVMTVHGAKGLESPIVILPDTAKPREAVRDEIFRIDGRAVWKTKADESPPEIASAGAAIKESQREERMRLLYVAMTRAEYWLIVCGSGEMGEGTDSWYSLVRDGLDKAGAVMLTPEDSQYDPGKRHEHGAWPERGPDAPEVPPVPVPLPEWARLPMQEIAEAAKLLSPSSLGGPKALPGEAGLDEDAAKSRGTLLHLLLEHLPLWPDADWPEIADGLLSGADRLIEADEVNALLTEAGHVLKSDEMAPLLRPDALVEVELTAPSAALGGRILRGTIDRLLVDEDRILVVDYKSNAIVPESPETVPEGLLRQMGAYADMLRTIYPNHRIDTAIFWTRVGRLMQLPHDMVRAALAATTIP